MKKNCNNCHHLEWIDGDSDGLGGDDGSGFDCGERHDEMHKQGREQELLDNLDRPEYREKAKRCHKPKSQ